MLNLNNLGMTLVIAMKVSINLRNRLKQKFQGQIQKLRGKTWRGDFFSFLFWIKIKKISSCYLNFAVSAKHLQKLAIYFIIMGVILPGHIIHIHVIFTTTWKNYILRENILTNTVFFIFICIVIPIVRANQY